MFYTRTIDITPKYAHIHRTIEEIGSGDYVKLDGVWNKIERIDYVDYNNNVMPQCDYPKNTRIPKNWIVYVKNNKHADMFECQRYLKAKDMKSKDKKDLE